MEFKELKEDLLKRAKTASACEDGYKMGLDATCKKDLLNAITANWRWIMSSSKMIDVAYLEAHFTQKELIAANIYTTGQHSIFSGVAYACGSSTVEACDSSTVEACDSSTVKAYDSSTVKAYGSSTVEAYNNAYVEDCTGNINKPSGYAIIKDYHLHRIYVKKGQFEIIEVE